MDQVKIGKYIARKRKEKGLTQTRVAEVLLVTDRAVSRWENGKNLPDMDLIPQLCDLYDITIDEFFSGEDIIEKETYKNKLNNDNASLMCLVFMVLLMFFTLPIANENHYVNKFSRFDHDTIWHQVETTMGKSGVVSTMVSFLKYNYGSKEVYLYFDGKEPESSLNSIIVRNNGLLSDTIILPFLDGTYTYTGEDDITITFENGTYQFNGDITTLGLDDMYSSGKCSFKIKEIVPDDDHYLYKIYLKDSYPLLIGYKTNNRFIIYNNDQEYLFKK